jgi:hypothetical protein
MTEMVDPNNPHWLKFQAYAQEGLLDLVTSLEQAGWQTEDAIEAAVARFQSQLFAAPNAIDSGSGESLPEFDEMGWLPATHLCSMNEFVRRFGTSSPRRQNLISHVQRIHVLALDCGGTRMVIGGSFVTACDEPDDVDIALLLPAQFFDRLRVEQGAAIRELWELSQRQTPDMPIDLFLERDETAWWSWYRLFSSTRHSLHLYRGVVEIQL